VKLIDDTCYDIGLYFVKLMSIRSIVDISYFTISLL